MMRAIYTASTSLMIALVMADYGVMKYLMLADSTLTLVFTWIGLPTVAIEYNFAYTLAGFITFAISMYVIIFFIYNLIKIFAEEK